MCVLENVYVFCFVVVVVRVLLKCVMRWQYREGNVKGLVGPNPNDFPCNSLYVCVCVCVCLLFILLFLLFTTDFNSYSYIIYTFLVLLLIKINPLVCKSEIKLFRLALCQCLFKHNSSTTTPSSQSTTTI